MLQNCSFAIDIKLKGTTYYKHQLSVFITSFKICIVELRVNNRWCRIGSEEWSVRLKVKNEGWGWIRNLIILATDGPKPNIKILEQPLLDEKLISHPNISQRG
jgi:hypothetical protein